MERAYDRIYTYSYRMLFIARIISRIIFLFETMTQCDTSSYSLHCIVEGIVLFRFSWLQKGNCLRKIVFRLFEHNFGLISLGTFISRRFRHYLFMNRKQTQFGVKVLKKNGFCTLVRS